MDDCDLIQAGTDPTEVLESIQSLINKWGSLMEVKGAALSPDKSWWYLVDFVFSHGKWIAHDAAPHNDLVATKEKGETVSLQRLCANEASEMLGVWVAPDGNNKKIKL